METYFARGGSFGGGHVSSSHVSSSRTSSTSSKSTSSSSKTSSKSSAATKKAPVTAQKTSTKPGTKIKTASGKTVKSSTAKPKNIKNAQEKGIVGANGYTPQFTTGYHPPAGSVVYYQDHSAIDYLPWIYLFSLGNNSPRNDQATVVQPDGKQVTAEPVKSGVDGMFILNWIILIIIVLAIIGGIVYLINKVTNKNAR